MADLGFNETLCCRCGKKYNVAYGHGCMKTLNDPRFKEVYHKNLGEWPSDLISGVMFYNGLRITRQDFKEQQKIYNS